MSLIVVLILGGLVVAARRRRAERPRDWLTVASLVTWRPLRRWAPFTVPVVVLVVGNRVRPGAGLVAAAAVVLLAWVTFPDLPTRARAWMTTRRAMDRYLKACVEAQVQGTTRWLRNPHPVPKRAELVAGNVRLEVQLPPALDRERLAEFDTRLAAGLDAAQVATEPAPRRPAGWVTVWLVHRQLAPGKPVDLVHAPADEARVVVGHGYRGPVVWRPDLEPGLGIFGGTGAGKGRLARWLALQWLDPAHNRRLVLIDPQGSGEWAPLASHPWATVLTYDPANPVEALTRIRDAVQAVLVDANERNQLCARAGVDNWASLPADLKVTCPRSMLLLDEASALLARTRAGTDVGKLTADVGQQLGVVYRTVRKSGWSPVHIDQATYSDDVTLAPGSIAQLGRWVALGGVRPANREQIAGFRDWPEYPPLPGLGLTGTRGDTNPQPIEVPDVDRAVVDDTLAVWSSHDVPVR